MGKYDNSAWGAYPSEILFYNARLRKQARQTKRINKRMARRAQASRRNFLDANDLKAISGAIHDCTRGYVALNRTPTSITATVTTSYFEAVRQGVNRPGEMQVFPINARMLRDLSSLRQ